MGCLHLDLVAPVPVGHASCGPKCRARDCRDPYHRLVHPSHGVWGGGSLRRDDQRLFASKHCFPDVVELSLDW